MGPRKNINRTFGTIVLAAILAVGVLPVGRAEAAGVARSKRGRWVTVRPGPGTSRGVVRAYLPGREIDVVTRIEGMVRDLPRNNGGLDGFPLVHRVVEPGLEGSAVAAMQLRVLDTFAGIVADGAPTLRAWPVTIVLARTQAFVARSMSELGCRAASEVVVMGATVCGRHVIVSNLTGFLFADRPGQMMTRELETRVEKPVARIPGYVVIRTAAALAHEFVHVWRAAALDGDVRGDEPKWFAEGLAEFWSGVAEVRSGAGSGTYLRRHVLRLRNFVDVRSVCPGTLSSYAQVSASGCEYHLGLFAVEYLVARHSSLLGSVAALARGGDYASFADWFSASFGLSVEEFSAEFDAYARAVRRESRA